MLRHGYCVAVKECADLGFVVNQWKPYATVARISVVDLARLKYAVCIRNSVKLRSAFPDQDTLPLASSWAGTADHNVEFFQIERS